MVLEKETISQRAIRKQQMNSPTPSNIQEEFVQEEFGQEEFV